jgi:hypothetical protein
MDQKIILWMKRPNLWGKKNTSRVHEYKIFVKLFQDSCKCWISSLWQVLHAEFISSRATVHNSGLFVRILHVFISHIRTLMYYKWDPACLYALKDAGLKRYEKNWRKLKPK